MSTETRACVWAIRKIGISVYFWENISNGCEFFRFMALKFTIYCPCCLGQAKNRGHRRAQNHLTKMWPTVRNDPGSVTLFHFLVTDRVDDMENGVSNWLLEIARLGVKDSLGWATKDTKQFVWANEETRRYLVWCLTSWHDGRYKCLHQVSFILDVFNSVGADVRALLSKKQQPNRWARKLKVCQIDRQKTIQFIWQYLFVHCC